VTPALRTAALAALCGALPASGNARVLWDRPGLDPYLGTLDRALDLFHNEGVPRWVLDGEARLYRAGYCRVRDLVDGETIDLMSFDQNRVLRDVVAETARWPAAAPRTVVDCRIDANGFEYRLLRPLACRNWSFQIVPFPFPPPLPTWPPAPGPGGAPGWFGGLYGANEEFFPAAPFGAFPAGFPAAPALSVSRSVSHFAVAPPIAFVTHVNSVRLHEIERFVLRRLVRVVLPPSPPPAAPAFPPLVPPSAPVPPAAGSPTPPAAPIPAPWSAVLLATFLALFAATRRFLRA
jgi:hypothetical protein